MQSLARIKTPHDRTDVRIPVPEFKADHQQPGTLLMPKEWHGQAVLLICGAGDNRVAFKWMLFDKLLADHIAVLTVDPPGHGDFMQVPVTVSTAQHAAKAASDWLHRLPGVTIVGVIGISFGGNQATWLTAHDERIAALVVMASPVKLSAVTRRVITREAINLLWPNNVRVLRHMAPLDIWTEWKSIKGAWYGESLYEMVDTFKMLDTVRRVGARPKLFVHGSRDSAVPSSNAALMYEAALPERELLIVPQATHLSVMLHEKPMTYVADWMRDKLRRVEDAEFAGEAHESGKITLNQPTAEVDVYASVSQ